MFIVLFIKSTHSRYFCLWVHYLTDFFDQIIYTLCKRLLTVAILEGSENKAFFLYNRDSYWMGDKSTASLKQCSNRLGKTHSSIAHCGLAHKTFKSQ